jgi:hypothetical protein
MTENDEDGISQGTSIHAGGDVIGVNVNGDKNIIGKNINVSKTSTDINQITINPQVLSNLDEQYANAFKQVIESLNNQIKQSRDVKPEQVANIQNSLEDLAKETEGIKPGEQQPEEKKKTWKDKFKIFAKYAVKALPKTAATLALFTPITASFSKQIEDGLQSVSEGIQAAMD